MSRLPPLRKTTRYPNDTNLLSWLFIISRDEQLLLRALLIMQFIKEHPTLSEEAVRKELALDALKNMPPKPLQ